MARISVIAGLAGLLLVVAANESQAQGQLGAQQGGFGNFGGAGLGTTPSGTGQIGMGTQGTFGTGTTGLGTGSTRTGSTSNSAFGSTSGRNNAFGSNSGLNSTNNQSMFNNNSMSQSGQQSQFGQQNTMGNNTQGTMQNQLGGQGAGRNSLGGNNQFGNLFQQQFRAQTAFGANPLFGNQQQRTGSGGQPALRLGFAVPMRPIENIEQGLESRLQAAATRAPAAMETKLDIEGVRINVGEAGVVRLTGEVANDAARRRAANVIRLEPGVKKIINEITVANAAK